MTRCELPLGPGYVLAVQRWAELEKAKIPAMALPTFKDLADKYMQDAIPLKSPRTQIENLRQMKNLLEFFCNSEPAQLEDIEPVHVRQYMDKRSKSGKVAANREKALLSHMWKKAR
ncbi:hypothetical protein [Chromobacterium haemolyticum]|uniref:hypothetical protein n=1 Tax=Chromobacterium haemolyticum TaxID=394935 RepID=UPI00307F327C